MNDEDKEKSNLTTIQIIKTGFYFLKALLHRINQDRLKVNAGYMTYVTLLSLVPMITVLFSALSLFPAFSQMGEQIQSFLLNNFVPASGDVLSQYLDQFVANAGKTTAVGMVFLFVTALMLISSIEDCLNYIWKITKKRRFFVSFSLYWMVLILGPVLLGSSLGISSYLSSLTLFGFEIKQYGLTTLLRFLPFFLSVIAFLGIYTLIPNTYVPWRNALIGAISASLLFEISKKLFAYYVIAFPSYQFIYGALATIPILFVWVYLSWIIVLLGAEITAVITDYPRWRPNFAKDELKKAKHATHISLNKKE
ncbi:MAG: virulence factor BrkB family protein [Enterovibrio sp.]